ncbi:MAG: fluoride efflux transporter CrcB [Kiritimatiellae bacterium]|nr:fluoride efflux transporter CrcB [Kiritimatiellia bacterium]
MNWLMVFLGSGAGGVARYALSLALNGRGWPWGTLAANVGGAFLIGMFGALSSRLGWSEQVRLLLTVGLCGGFTTFSTFSNESLAMLRAGNWLAAGAYIVASLVLGLAATYGGWRMAA